MRSIGIDAVEIERFKHWHTYSTRQLQKIFTLHEIAYCLESIEYSAQRFAVRFAAKEAAYKALSSLGNIDQSFISIASALEIKKTDHVPCLVIHWDKIKLKKSPTNYIISHCSLTHTKTAALAVIVLV